jgi:hypothetical protein
MCDIAVCVLLWQLGRLFAGNGYVMLLPDVIFLWMALLLLVAVTGSVACVVCMPGCILNCVVRFGFGHSIGRFLLVWTATFFCCVATECFSSGNLFVRRLGLWFSCSRLRIPMCCRVVSTAEHLPTTEIGNGMEVGTRFLFFGLSVAHTSETSLFYGNLPVCLNWSVISDELCFPYMAMPTIVIFKNLYL